MLTTSIPKNTMPTANLPTLVSDATAAIANTVRAAENPTDSPVTATTGKIAEGDDTSPICMAFTVQYTELGLEHLYAELASHNSDVERTRHVKRCLFDIVRGDFKRPSVNRLELDDNDRDSFTIQIRLSSRDVGLEAFYGELKQLKTTFKRNNALRRKLYDAFNQIPIKAAHSVESALTFAVGIESLPRLATYGDTPSPAKPMVPQALDRRRAARQANADQFNSN